MSSLARRCSARLAAYVRAVPSTGSSLMASPRSTPPSRCMASGAFCWARVYSSDFAATYSSCLCVCALVASGARSTIAGLRCSFLRSTIPRPCSCSTSRCPRCSSSTWHPQLAGQVFSLCLAPALVGLRALSPCWPPMSATHARACWFEFKQPGLVVCLLGIAAWVQLYHPFFKSLGLSAGSDRMFTAANSLTSANASVRMTPALVAGPRARRPASQGKGGDVAKRTESPCHDWGEKHQHAQHTSEGTRSVLREEEVVHHSAATSVTADTRQDIKTPHFSARPPNASSKQSMVATARGETPQMTFMTPAQYHASVLHSVYGGRVR